MLLAAVLALRVVLDPSAHEMRVSGRIAPAKAQFALTALAGEVRVDGATLESKPFAGGALNLWTVSGASGNELRFSYRIRTETPKPKLFLGPEIAFAEGSWYPMLDNRGRDTGTIEFDAPKGWRVIATGTALGQRAYKIDKPSGFAFAAAPYAVTRRGNLSVWLDAKRKPVAPLLDRLAQIAGVLEGAFGALPYGALAVAEIPGAVAEASGVGADTVENMVMINGNYLAEPPKITRSGLLLFAHEIAHQWWGNLLRRKSPQEPLFLNEAMANYAAMLALESLEGRAAAAQFRRDGIPGYYDDVQNARGFFRLLKSGAPIGPQEWAKSKGFLIHSMLADELGRDAYHAALRDFLRAHAFDVASVAELRDFLEQRTGRDLHWFFEQWLERSGAPDFRVEGNRIVQSEPPYRATLDVVIGGATQRVTVTGVETPLPSEGSLLDPEYRVLRWLPEFK